MNEWITNIHQGRITFFPRCRLQGIVLHFAFRLFWLVVFDIIVSLRRTSSCSLKHRRVHDCTCARTSFLTLHPERFPFKTSTRLRTLTSQILLSVGWLGQFSFCSFIRRTQYMHVSSLSSGWRSVTCSNLDLTWPYAARRDYRPRMQSDYTCMVCRVIIALVCRVIIDLVCRVIIGLVCRVFKCLRLWHMLSWMQTITCY